MTKYPSINHFLRRHGLLRNDAAQSKRRLAKPSIVELLEDRTLLAGAAVSGMTPSGETAGPVTSVSVTFDEIVQPATFTTDDVFIYGPDGLPINLSGMPVDTGDQLTFTLNLAAPTELAGTYRVLIGPDVLDADGDPMNQDGDATDGEATADQFQGSFTTAAIPQTLPVLENFDSGNIASLSGWSFKSHVGKLIEVTNANNPISGQYHLQLGQTQSGESFGSAILALDLSADSGATDLTLDFWTKELTASSSNYIQIYASGDGTTWVYIPISTSTADGEYVHYAYDLDQRLATAGIALDADVFIEFRHRGISTSHRTTLDDVRVARGIDAFGPAVISQSPNTPQAGPVSFIDITFDEPIDGASFTANDIFVTSPVGNPVALAGDPVDSGDQLTWRIHFASPQTQAGNYAFRIGPDVRDLSGNQMDQLGDGSNGRVGTDDYDGILTISAPAITLPFTENFEGGDIFTLTDFSFATTGVASLEVSTNYNPAEGTQHLVFGQSGTGTGTSSAILKLDLSTYVGATDLTLDFQTQERTTGSSNYMQFWVSGDGNTWHHVDTISNTPVNENYHINYDLDAALNSKGIVFDSDVYIELRHNSIATSYITTIDSLRIAQGIDVLGPQVISRTPDAPLAGPLNFVEVTFDDTIDSATFTAAAITFNDPLGNPVALSSDPIDTGDQKTWRLNFASPQNQAGLYSLIIANTVRDESGNLINQNQDEINGLANDQYSTTFDLLTSPITSLPYLQNFEDGSVAALNPGWSFASTGTGTVEVTSDNLPYAGNYHLEFAQTSSVSSTSSATLKLDLTSYVGANDLTIDFWTKELTTGSSNYLQLYVSDNASTWKFVDTVTNTPLNEYVHIAYDLDQALNAQSITFDSDVYVQFRHNGVSASYITTIDDLRIAQGVDVFGPKVNSISPNTPQAPPLNFVDITFNEPVDGATLLSSVITVKDPLNNEITLVGDPVDSGDQMTWRLNFQTTQILPGIYSVSIPISVRDVAGNPLNQIGDETNGQNNDAFSGTFEIAAVKQTIPFNESFESGDIHNLPGWSFATSGIKIIDVNGDGGPHSGNNHLYLGQQLGGDESKGEAILALDLSAHVGATDLTLDFWLKELSGGSSSYGQLWVSGDGQSWTYVTSLESEPASYAHYGFDLDNVLSTHGVAIDDGVYIKVLARGISQSHVILLDDVRVDRGLDVFGPAVISQTPVDRITGSLDFIDVTFNEPIDPLTFTADAVTVTGPLGDPVLLASDPVDSGDGTTWRLPFATTQTQQGNYLISIAPTVTDTTTNLLNQDGDATNGEPFDRYNEIVTISAPAVTTYPYFQDFEGPNFADLTNWEFSVTTPNSIGLTDDLIPHSGTQHLYFVRQSGGATTKEAILSLDLSSEFGANDLSLDFQYKSISSTSSNNIQLYVSPDGQDWSFVGTYTPTVANEYQQFQIDLDQVLTARGIALDTNVFIKFTHPGSTTGRTGVLDDVRIARGEFLTLEVSTPSISEGTATNPTVRISRPTGVDLSSPLTVNLTTNDPTEATIQSQVTIPANTPFIDVPLIIHDDALVDGPQNVTITASGAGFGSDVIRVDDDEARTLTLESPVSAINEADGPEAAYLTLRRNRDIDTPLTVNLVVDDLSEGSVQSTVTIPAGSDHARFYIGTNNDGIIDGTQTIQLTASVTDYISDIVALDVLDDDTAINKTIGGLQFESLPQDTYRVLFDATVPSGVSYQIAPSSTLRFLPQTGLTVVGQLLAEGAMGTEISFISDAAMPLAGDWDGLRFDNVGSPRSLLDYVHVLHGTVGVTVVASGTSPEVSITNSEIAYSSNSGLTISAGGQDRIYRDDVLIQQNSIHHNGNFGVYIVAGSSLNYSGESSPTISDNEIVDNFGDGIFLDADPFSQFLFGNTSAIVDPFIAGNHIARNEYGIRGVAYESQTQDGNANVNSVIVNNLIESNLIDGIYITGTSSLASVKPKIINNTIVENGGAGIRTSELHSNTLLMVIANNIIVGNDTGIETLVASGPSAGQVVNNLVYGNTTANWMNYPASFGDLTTFNANGTPADAEMNISVDPLFIGAGNYHLQAGSPAINAGSSTPADTPTDDIDDQLRSLAPDVGYDEVPNQAPGISLLNVVNTLAENTSTASAIKIADISVTDDGQGPNVLSLTGADAAAFEIVGNALYLKAGVPLDYESKTAFQVTVNVDDSTLGGSPDATQSLQLDITDVNDVVPSIALLDQILLIGENTDTSSRIKVARISIIDPDGGPNTLSLSGADVSSFEIVNDELFIKAGTVLDFETQASLSVIVNVNDPTLGATPDDNATYTLDLINLNDTPPDLQLSNVVTSLPENTPTVTRVRVADIQIIDPDPAPYTLGLTGADAALFEVFSGNLYLRAGTVLDFETQSQLQVTLSVDDSSVGSTPDASTSFTLNITDSNEAPTAITVNNATTTVAESLDTSSRVKLGDVLITDDAVGSNVVSLSGADAAVFEVIGTELFLRAGTVLDFETQSQLQVTLSVDDSSVGSTPDASTSFTLNITDSNEHDPFVNPATFTVDENEVNGTVVGQVVFGDLDTADSVALAITSGNVGGAFQIDANGVIRVADQTKLDFEATPVIQLTITATDTGSPQRTGQGTVTIELQDRLETDVLLFDTLTGATQLATSQGYHFAYENGPDWSGLAVQQLFTADFTGDGRADVGGVSASHEFFVSVNTGDGLAEPVLWGTVDGAHLNTDLNIGDFNGDGRDDFVARGTDGRWWVQYSTGTSFNEVAGPRWSLTGWQDGEALIGDYDGDGKDDIALRQEVQIGFTTAQWYVAFGDVNGLNTVYAGAWNETSYSWDDLRVGDFNGDGKDDITARMNLGGWFTLQIPSGNRFQMSLLGVWSNTLNWRDVTVGDVNGDGRDDIVAWEERGLWWGLYGGTGVSPIQFYGAWSASAPWMTSAGDFNGDGRLDIVGFNQTTGAAWSLLATGTNFTATTFFGIATPSANWIIIGNEFTI